jgi:adenylate cyclase
VLLAMSLLMVVVASNLAAWVFARLALPMAAILLLVAMLLALHLFFGYFVEHRAKRTSDRAVWPVRPARTGRGDES